MRWRASNLGEYIYKGEVTLGDSSRVTVGDAVLYNSQRGRKQPPVRVLAFVKPAQPNLPITNIILDLNRNGLIRISNMRAVRNCRSVRAGTHTHIYGDWFDMHTLPKLRPIMVLLDRPEYGSFIHTAMFYDNMQIVAGHFLHDLEGKVIAWRELPAVPAAARRMHEEKENERNLRS